jgi:hypothetical protein
MKRIPKAIYQTPAQLAERIQRRTVEAHEHPTNSDERQAILKEIAQLRAYLEAKLWIESPGLKPGR